MNIQSNTVVRFCVLVLGIYFLASSTVWSNNPTHSVGDKKTNPQRFSWFSKGRKESAKQPAKVVYARSTFYNKNEEDADADTKKKKTSTQINVSVLEARGLGAVAVDPAVIPYGSKVVAPNGKVFIAVDTGSAVVKRQAAKELALTKGLSAKSAEYKAPVLDFYSYRQVGSMWDHFHVVPYRGDRPFKQLKLSEKIAYIARKVSET